MPGQHPGVVETSPIAVGTAAGCPPPLAHLSRPASWARPLCGGWRAQQQPGGTTTDDKSQPDAGGSPGTKGANEKEKPQHQPGGTSTDDKIQALMEKLEQQSLELEHLRALVTNKEKTT